jgi:hypothetical protein
MPEFIVAIEHIPYYAVQAEDEVTAIDLALEGQGLEIDSRRAMPISAGISRATRISAAVLDNTRNPTVDSLQSHRWSARRGLVPFCLIRLTHVATPGDRWAWSAPRRLGGGQPSLVRVDMRSGVTPDC